MNIHHLLTLMSFQTFSSSSENTNEVIFNETWEIYVPLLKIHQNFDALKSL